MAMNVALKLAIIQSGKSQVELAYLTGINDTQLSKLVRGWRVPSEQERDKLSAILGVKAEKLFPNRSKVRGAA